MAEEPSAEILSRFNAFIEQAKAVLEHRELPVRPPVIPETSDDPVSRFDLFVTQARPIVTEQIKTTLRTHGKRLDNICRWIVPQSYDVLTAVGLSRDEVRYTRLIAWMLWPEERPDLALTAQSHFRRRMNAIRLEAIVRQMSQKNR